MSIYFNLKFLQQFCELYLRNAGEINFFHAHTTIADYTFTDHAEIRKGPQGSGVYPTFCKISVIDNAVRYTFVDFVPCTMY